MLTKDGAKLLDCGIAKLRVSPTTSDSTALTNPGMILGTLSYMAPEQLEGQHVDARADIFAFGAIVYQMLTGKRAFDGGSQARIIAAVLHTDPPAVSTLQPLTPPSLERVAQRCLAKNPDDRWQDARDLLAELRWIADTLQTKGSRRFAARGGTWRRAMLGPFLLIVIAGAGLVIWRGVPLPSATSRPVVILMDSPLPERVYDPETRKNGGTNADDLTDDLRDLGVELHKETTGGLWHREDQILKQNPTLLIMHLSSFADSRTETQEPLLTRYALEKLRAFLGYVGLGNPRTRFLIYTRWSAAEFDSDKWIAETETRFPALKGRIAIMHVPGGVPRATFRDPATAREISDRVSSMIRGQE